MRWFTLNYDRLDNAVKFYSMISYIGPLFILTRMSKRRFNKSMDFHSWQGGILFFTVVFLNILAKCITNLLYVIPAFAEIIGLLLHIGVWTFWVILSIMGVVNAYKMDEKYLPIIGWIDNIFKNHYKYM